MKKYRDRIKQLAMLIETVSGIVEFYNALLLIEQNPSKTKCVCGDKTHHKPLGVALIEQDLEKAEKKLAVQFKELEL